MPDNVLVLPVKVAPSKQKVYFRIGGKTYELEIKAQITPVPQERELAKVLVMPDPGNRWPMLLPPKAHGVHC